MAGTAETLQSYLIKLGFSTDAISLKKFSDNLSDTGKKVMNVGAGVASTVASVEAATAAFAYSMRKMYYNSELAGTSVNNLKAMEYAANQVGVSNEQMEGTIMSLGMTMKNPGMLQYASALTGVNQAGRDTTSVLTDLMKATERFQPMIGAKVMEQFGMSDEMYYRLRGHMGELMKMRGEYLKLAKDSGVDPKKAENVIKEYTHQLDQLEQRLSLLGQSLMISLVGPFEKAVTYLNELIQKVTDFSNSFTKKGPNGKSKAQSDWEDFKQYGGGAIMNDVKSEASTIGASNMMWFLKAFNVSSLIGGSKGGTPQATLGATGGGAPGSVSTQINNNVVINGSVDAERLSKNLAKDTAAEQQRLMARYSSGVPR